MKRIYLFPRKSGAAIGRHPWVFTGAIESSDKGIDDGEAVAVYGGTDQRFIAYGFFNSKSDIRVRLLSWDEAIPIDESFFRYAIKRAIDLRENLGLLTSDSGTRLIFSESDFLPGFTVDRYGEYLVVQVTSLALFQRLSILSDLLCKRLEPKGILLKATPDLWKKEGIFAAEKTLWGEVPQNPVWIQDVGLKFEVSLSGGQKTGFYLDQRENRIAAAKYAKGRSALDLYCNSGGFALHALAVGAEVAVGVDSSALALASAERNTIENNLKNARWIESDVLEFLGKEGHRKFSMVILDPPRFATSKGGVERAMKMYYRLNTESLKVLEPGGILVSCSCSGRVSQDEWVRMLSSVAARSKRSMQMLEIRGAAADHPVSAHCPETQYLKCVIARVF